MNLFGRLQDEILELIINELNPSDILQLAATSRSILERYPILHRLFREISRISKTTTPFTVVGVIDDIILYNFLQRNSVMKYLPINHLSCLIATASAGAVIEMEQRSRHFHFRWREASVFVQHLSARGPFCWNKFSDLWTESIMILPFVKSLQAIVRWWYRRYGAARKRLYDPSNPFERAVEIWTENWYSLMINKYEPTRLETPVWGYIIYPPSLSYDHPLDIHIDGAFVATVRFHWTPNFQTYASRSEVRAHFISLFPQPPLPPQISTTTTTAAAEANGSTTTRSWPERRPAPLPKGRQARSTSGGTRPVRTRERWRGPRNGRRQNGHHAFR